WKAVLILIFLVPSGILRAQDGDDPVEVMVSHDWYLTKIKWEGDEYPFDPETDNDGEQATLEFSVDNDGYYFMTSICLGQDGHITIVDENHFNVEGFGGLTPTNCQYNEIFNLDEAFWTITLPSDYSGDYEYGLTLNVVDTHTQLIIEDPDGDKEYYQDEPYLAVSDFAKNDLRIYPNPAKEYLYFENLHQKTRLEILDIAGRKRLARELNGTAAERVHIDRLPTGIYFNRLRQNGAIVKTGKLIKN